MALTAAATVVTIEEDPLGDMLAVWETWAFVWADAAAVPAEDYAARLADVFGVAV